MIIALGSDHGGFQLKETVRKYLEGKGYQVIDEGPSLLERVDYPIYAAMVARAVSGGQANFGIVFCTSGEGVCIAANKVKGAYCGLGYNDEVASLLRQHNNANMIAFSEAFMKPQDVLRRIDIFLSTDFLGGHHQPRIDEIKAIEDGK